MNRIKLRARRVLSVDGMRIAEGCTFKVDEKTATELLRWGDAELVSQPPIDREPWHVGRMTTR